MSKEIFDIVDSIVQEKGTSISKVIPILQEIQLRFNFLPELALQRVCEITDITPAIIYSVSSFYSQFRHKPVGKHIIKVCVGTACHVKGAMFVYDSIKRALKMGENDDTDAEGLFTIEKVACLGCCTIAPVVQIDDVTYGHVTTEKVPEIIKDFLYLQHNPKSNGLKERYTGLPSRGEIRIGLGSCCVASGSSEVKHELENTIYKNKLNVDVKQVGCVGICNQVPMLEIRKTDEKSVLYTKINAQEVKKIILTHFKPQGFFTGIKSKLERIIDNFAFEGIPELAHRYNAEQRDTPVSDFLDNQINIATEFRGVLSPLDIDEYKQLGGFTALRKCFLEGGQDEIIEKIKASGLRGRGGAGFPTGVKWEIVKSATSDIKYIICNGDEGDPGAFMDRMLLESYPFRIIEGMIISALAVGANHGIFYIRAEYKLAVRQVTQAIKICKEKGYLGTNILKSGLDFDIELFEGAGAFVCGEETALIASIEGERGFPRLRPPFPSNKGLRGKPTLINNTETFSLVSWIIRKGSENFSKIGTHESKGTKVFALAGKINRGGLIEVPMGTSIRQIVYDIGGGIANHKRFKAVQIGGPSGGCIPAELSDTPVDYESLKMMGAMMGSGGLIVLDETDCMVDIAKYFLSFTQDQSCGKCTFCRIGTRKMLEILEKISDGKGKPEDIDTLEALANKVKAGSLCGLGKTAPNPVLSTLKYYKDEYVAHINGTCPTGKCKALIAYTINNNCIGCTKCAQACPSEAILTTPHERHEIIQDKCIKCDACKQICPTGAVIIK